MTLPRCLLGNSSCLPIDCDTHAQRDEVTDDDAGKRREFVVNETYFKPPNIEKVSPASDVSI